MSSVNLSCNVRDLVNKQIEEPCFFINFHNCGRGIYNYDEDNKKPFIETTKVLIWRIVNNDLVKCADQSFAVLFDCETYIVQWIFEFKIDKTLMEDSVVYYWKGNFAVKGFSPLPSNLEENCPVDRIRQWSEPPVFLQIFNGQVVVFSGKQTEFNPHITHLFIARGEIESEIHLYELPCEKRSLRSRSSFVLILPKENSIIFWHGLQTLSLYKDKLIKLQKVFQNYEQSWKEFSISQTYENNENELFLKNISGSNSDYLSPKTRSNFTPRLFYFNSVTGSYTLSEVEYTLRLKNKVAPFPFLQSHLYSANQPAIFLIDNYYAIWLWSRSENYSSVEFQDMYQIANSFANEYRSEKESTLGITVEMKYVKAYSEPLEFTNIFPYWENKSVN